MYWRVLDTELDGLSAEARLWLVQFVLRFGRASSGVVTLVEMQGLTGLSRYLFKHAWRELEAGGYLERKPVPVWAAGNTGRRYTYSLGKRTQVLLDASGAPAPRWSRLIVELIVGRVDPQQASLRAGSRLLLAVLCLKADEFGVVRGVGSASLRRLTGLNENRLKIHLQRLKAVEYVRAVVPGVSGGALFGVAKGAYFLNLGHHSFGSFGQAMTLFVDAALPQYRIPEVDRLDATYAERLCGDVYSALPWPERPMRALVGALKCFGRTPTVVDLDPTVASLFLTLSRQEVRDYQQYKLEEYASHLLSEHWVAVQDQEVVELLEVREWVGLQFPRIKGEEQLSVEERKGLAGGIDAIVQVAAQLAQDIQQGMARFPEVPFDQMRHCILPRSIGKVPRFGISVLSLPKAGSRVESKCYVLKTLGPWKQELEVFADESALLSSDRYWYGLVSGPLSGPKRYHTRDPALLKIIQQRMDGNSKKVTDS